MTGGAASVARPGAGPRVAWLAAAAALLAAWAAMASGAFGPPCAFREATGLACPTCGLTRALVTLARGDGPGSLALHPWAAPLAAQALGAWVLWGAWLAGRLRARPDRWLPHAVAVNGAALALLWLARLAAGALPR